MVADTPVDGSERGHEHNARGLFVIGPQFVTPSDLLAQLQGFTYCREAPDPNWNAKKQRRMRLFSPKEAQRQRELR